MIGDYYFDGFEDDFLDLPDDFELPEDSETSSDSIDVGYYLVVLDSTGEIDNIITDSKDILKYIKNEEDSKRI